MVIIWGASAELALYNIFQRAKPSLSELAIQYPDLHTGNAVASGRGIRNSACLLKRVLSGHPSFAGVNTIRGRRSRHRERHYLRCQKPCPALNA
jgi:hypothetical protein